MEFHAVADLDAGSVAFECVGLGVACAEFESAGVRKDAALQCVVVVFDCIGDAHRCSYDDRCDAYCINLVIDRRMTAPPKRFFLPQY